MITDEDSLECAKRAYLYKSFLDMGNYPDALNAWRWVYEECPELYLSVYQDGARIFKHLITGEKDENVKDRLVDTLIMIYDKRIEYFGDHEKYPECYILGIKGKDLLLYKDDPESIRQAYECLKKSVDCRKDKTDVAILDPFVRAAIKMNEKGNISDEELLIDYFLAIEILDNKQSKPGVKEKELSRIRMSREIIERSLKNSSLVKNKKLLPALELLISRSAGNIILLNNIVILLNKLEETDNNTYFKALEIIQKEKPSAISAHSLAVMSIKKGDHKKAVKYYKQAIDFQKDNNEKAKYYLEMASIYFQYYKNYSKAREYALKAAAIRTNWGDPYIFIGRIYAASSQECGKEVFEQQAVYWVAVDKFEKAKTIDPSVAGKADELINSHVKHFPLKQDIFFNPEVEEGDPYTVGCWINEKTTARGRPE